MGYFSPVVLVNQVFYYLWRRHFGHADEVACHNIRDIDEVHHVRGLLVEEGHVHNRNQTVIKTVIKQIPYDHGDDACNTNRVIIPVHLCGQSADMKAICAIARSYGISVIEDASHAIGATYEGKPVGDCRYSEITVFSFHPVKIITTAEGGLATTQNQKLAESMDLARSHGITRDPTLYEEPSQGSWYYGRLVILFYSRLLVSQHHRFQVLKLQSM